MSREFRFDSEAREALRAGVNKLADAVCVTLGPRGRNVVIERRSGPPSITNDGVTIAREITLVDPNENLGAQLMREVATKTQETAGDGTTTACVLARAMVNEGSRYVAAGANPMGIKRGMEKAGSAVASRLVEMSRRVEERDAVLRVATIAANHDPAVGRWIADALDRVGDRGVVQIEEAPGVETELDVTEGIRIDSGYVSPYFVTDPDTMEVRLDKPLVLLTNRKITRFADLLPALETAATAGRGLLVIAEDVEDEALATLVVNRLKGATEVCAIKAPDFGERREERLDDIAVVTGGTVLRESAGRVLESATLADLGTAARIVVERDRTTIVAGDASRSAVAERVASLEHALSDEENRFDHDRLAERLALLTGGVAVIRVGAFTEPERAERKGRVGDALSAARAAVAEGVVPGGGVALLRALDAVRSLSLTGDEAHGRDVVIHALAAPVAQIAANAGEDGAVVAARVVESARSGVGFDARSLDFADVDARNILDPTRVTRAAFQHAVSIGGMILTTDAVVTHRREDDDPDDEG